MSTGEQTTRRDELVTIAGRLFARYGYHGTGIRQIASAADLQSATLYGHFKNKPNILLDVIRPYLEHSYAELATIAHGDAPAAEKLARMVRASIDVNRQHHDAFITFFNEWKHIHSTPELADLVVLRDKNGKVWKQTIDAAISDGTLPQDVDPRQVQWLLYAAITGMSDNRHADTDGDTTVDPPVDLLLDVLANGLWRSPAGRRRR